MSKNLYTFAVTRLRSKELELLNGSFIDQLIGCKTHEDCRRLLGEKGWGKPEESDEEVLRAQRQKTWELMGELVDDLSVFDVFLYPADYHNLKTAIKMVCTGASAEGVFVENGTIPREVIVKAVEEHDYAPLPEEMRQAAEKAFRVLLHTHDGQLCDILLDRAALSAILKAGKASGSELIAGYAERTVAAADIKTAVRCAGMKKKKSFVQDALAPCDSLDVSALADAAVKGLDAICEYLQYTPYADAIEQLRESPSAFERWCDDLIIREIRPQLHNPFTIGPLCAYILARENEIKTVRIILAGKRNGLSEEFLRERAREMYV